jgi:Bacteriophage Mu Gp45 spike protein
MHRATPANSSFRAYTAGGARAFLEKIGDAGIVDDLKGVQQIAAGFMKGEARKGIEHAQQYGFTSLPFDPDEAKDGKQGMGPETFISFIGGNRSFPSAGPVDDRRHRLKGLEKGDVALFGGKDTGQQLHMNGIGTFLSAFAGAGKKLRLQLQQKPAQASGGASTFAEGDAAGGQAGAKEELGQKPNYKNESAAYFEVDDAGTKSVNKAHEMSLPDGTAVIVRDGQVYLGGDPAKGHRFGRVATDAGFSLNVNARVP